MKKHNQNRVKERTIMFKRKKRFNCTSQSLQFTKFLKTHRTKTNRYFFVVTIRPVYLQSNPTFIVIVFNSNNFLTLRKMSIQYLYLTNGYSQSCAYHKLCKNTVPLKHFLSNYLTNHVENVWDKKSLDKTFGRQKSQYRLRYFPPD